MPDIKSKMKKAAAIEATGEIKSGMVLGIGTGSTMVFFIEEIGRLIREGDLKDISGVPTSFQSSILSAENGIKVLDFNDVDHIDMAIDGADEADPHKNLIKGGGAAHTREKLIDYFADKLIIVIDEGKRVKYLGENFPVPVEVIPQAYRFVLRELEKLGASAELRIAVKKSGPVITDQGNFVLDARFKEIKEPAVLENHINQLPGVLENGLFVNQTDLVIVGTRQEKAIKVIRF